MCINCNYGRSFGTHWKSLKYTKRRPFFATHYILRGTLLCALGHRQPLVCGFSLQNPITVRFAIWTRVFFRLQTPFPSQWEWFPPQSEFIILQPKKETLVWTEDALSHSREEMETIVDEVPWDAHWVDCKACSQLGTSHIGNSWHAFTS
jgi:hypothetical protein